MKYMGSKSRIKKYVVPFLQKLIEENGIDTYIEPFVGGANVIDDIQCQNRIGGDLHDKLIALLKYVQNGGELPLEVPKGALIYCDIPYKGTKQFSVGKNFNHDEFWQWVRGMSKNNIVVVSELQAPNDFECVWEQPVLRTQNAKKREVSIEKLFMIKQ